MKHCQLVCLITRKKNNFILFNQDRIHFGVKIYTKAKDKPSESSSIFHIEEEKGMKKEIMFIDYLMR